MTVFHDPIAGDQYDLEAAFLVVRAALKRALQNARHVHVEGEAFGVFRGAPGSNDDFRKHASEMLEEFDALIARTRPAIKRLRALAKSEAA